MTTFGKIFTIFITLASLAFMGFAMVTYYGGPNYQAEQVEKLPDYVFKVSKATKEKPAQWAVETRLLGETVSTSAPTLPGVVVAARKHLDGKLNEQIKAQDMEIPAVEARIAEAKELIKIDLEALKKRQQELQAELDARRAEIKALADQGIEKSKQSYALQAETARRREDVFRLVNQLEEIRTDFFRAVEQAEKLDDLLVRVRGTIDRSQRRNDQLRGATERPKNEPYDPKP